MRYKTKTALITAGVQCRYLSLIEGCNISLKFDLYMNDFNILNLAIQIRVLIVFLISKVYEFFTKKLFLDQRYQDFIISSGTLYNQDISLNSITLKFFKKHINIYQSQCKYPFYICLFIFILSLRGVGILFLVSFNAVELNNE